MRTSRLLSGVSLIAATLLYPTIAHAQDSHYWTRQYGSRAELLGGGVVGSLLDVSATFYNPGALILVNPKEYLQAAEPFEIQSVAVRNIGQDGEDLSTLDLGAAPSLFAGLLPVGWLGGRWAYSTLTRHEFDLNLKNRRMGTGDFLPGEPGLETRAVESTFKQGLSELWFGLTWSRQIHEGVGLGITHYFTYRGQSSRSQTIAQTATQSGNGASATFIDDFDYWTLGILWKLGVAFDYAPLTFGFSLTTPDLDYYGTGKAFFNRNFTNVDVDGNGMGESFLVNELHEGLTPRHDSPLSLAGGMAYRFGNAGVHVGVEYFAPVSAYTVLDAGVEETIGGELLTRRLTDQADGVVNGGIGVEYHATERFRYFGSFRTDFSSSVPDSDANLSITRWDLYHFSAGTTIRFQSVDVTLGLNYAVGSEDLGTRLETASSIGLVQAPGSVHVEYKLFRVLFGFTFKTI